MGATRVSALVTMKLVLLFVLVCLAALNHAERADDPPLDMDEGQFEKYFHLKAITDPEEYERRNAALKANEELVLKTNKKFDRDDISWYTRITSFADLPEDEFLEQKTGAFIPDNFGRGLLEPAKEQEIDEHSEQYFAQVRMDRSAVPDSYSSVDAGIVSPVKEQGQCGSCVAFASMAAIETCFKNFTGVFGDYSEQQLIDCGYKQEGANGCHGAPPHAYLTWAARDKIVLASEAQYPYENLDPRLKCPAVVPVFNQGARITDSYYTYQGDENLMKKLVYQHGAVVAAVKSQGPFSLYEGGVFAGCPPTERVDHAITVVGYGREGGLDYWLIKNSWGPYWGENGFIKLQRGVNMCGIGRAITTVSCGPL